ncbi:hypothetical protein Bbelb_257320 [Branchiostoma belcheri]|nr:hypothetical protein Bbelb_257320 [Branchiostoma belcheri]
MATASCHEVPLPESIRPHICTSLAWDNIDRLEETLSGEGTSHRVNGIAVQANHFGPHLPSRTSTPPLSKSKKRSIESMGDITMPIYNAWERCGPPCRKYVEVTSWQEEAWRKNLLWILVRMHAREKQTIPGWTGFNILPDAWLRMGVFHTICTFLSVIGKRFEDAGLRYVCFESGIIAEGSVPGVMGGRKYNRAIQFHKLMFEALNRLVWTGFLSWTEEHHEGTKPLVDDFFTELESLHENPCEQESNGIMASP